jgi:site-specific recombinase XerD
LDTEEKLAAMELRMAYIRDHSLASMMPAGLTAKQAETAYRNALHRSGFTKANGCNNHAARHHFAQQEINGGKSRWEVSVSLGHHRLAIIDSYVPRQR